MDVVDSDTRSRMMAGIGSKNTKPELIVRRFLHAMGFRYRLHERILPGRPDLVFPKYGVVIFINGCFWHRHPNCKYSTLPKSNSTLWNKKFRANVSRDKKNIQRLIEKGWRVIVIWECGLKLAGKKEKLDWLPSTITNGTDSFVEWPVTGNEAG